MTYEDVKKKLAALPAGTEETIAYQFVPDENGNYIGETPGSLQFIIKEVGFTVNGERRYSVQCGDGKENPVYGDSWKRFCRLRRLRLQLGRTTIPNSPISV